MTHIVHSRWRQRAFTLIEMAMSLAIVGLMTGFVLKANQATAPQQECYPTTKSQLAAIRTSVENFARQRDRLPLPALRTVGVEDIKYGRESATGNTVAGATTWGAIPFQALALSPVYATDCWGNKLTYVVTTALTTNAAIGGYKDPTVHGSITLMNSLTNVTSITTSYAVISHGEDALGAIKANATTGSWCVGAELKHVNCSAAAATVLDGTYNNGKSAGVNYYDDLIVTGTR